MPSTSRRYIRPLSLQGLDKLYDIYIVGIPEKEKNRTWIEEIPYLVPEAQLFHFELFGLENTGIKKDAFPEGSGDAQYETESKGRTSALSVEALEKEAYALLDAIQQPQATAEKPKSNNVVLVGYGLGDATIKKALILANSEPRYYEIALRVVKVITVGAPRLGPSVEAWEDYLWSIHQKVGLMIHGRKSQVLGDLAAYADRANTQFLSHASQYDLNYVSQSDLSGKPVVEEPQLRALLAPFALLNQGAIYPSRDDQADAQGHFLDFLQMLSFSSSSIYNASDSSILDELTDTIIYSQYIDQWKLETLTKPMAIQLVGPRARGKATLLNVLIQKFRQLYSDAPAFTVIVLEIPWITLGSTAATHHAIVVSLLHQILSQMPSLFYSFHGLYLEHSQLDTWTERTLSSLLFTLLGVLKSWKLIVAIENFHKQSQDAQQFFRDLAKHLSDLGSDYLLLLTSSEEPSPDIHAAKICTFDFSSSGDILFRKYVQTEISRMVFLHPVLQPLQERIRQRFETLDLSHSNVHLFMSHFSRMMALSTLEAVESVFQTCPQDELEIHRSSMQYLIKEKPAVLGWCALITSWVLHAARPLRAHELAVAAATPLALSDSASIQSHVATSIKEDIDRHLYFLLKTKNDIVCLFSSATEEMLTTVLANDATLGSFKISNDCELARLCMDYLTAMIRDKWAQCLVWLDRQCIIKSDHDCELGFLDYAVRHWPTHYRRVPIHDREDLDRRVLEFLSVPSLRANWYRLFYLNSPLRRKEHSDISVLEIVSELGFTALVRTTLERADCKSDSGSKELGDALSAAVRSNRSDVVNILLEAGAQSSKTIWYAARNGNVQLLGHLCKLEDSKHKGDIRPEDVAFPDAFPLHIATQAAHLDAVQALLDLGFNAADKDGRKRTPLHAAAIGGDIEVIRLMLKQHGYDVNSQDNDGHTALILAARMGQIDVLRELCAFRGTKFHLTENNGLTALHFAVQSHTFSTFGADSEAVAVLLMHSAGLQFAKDNAGTTPLHLACTYGSFNVLKQLVDSLDKGASVDPRDDKDRTPLHLAAASGNLKAVCFLMEHHADLAAKDSMQQEPVELAAFSGHLDIVKLLYPAAGSDARENLLRRASENGHLLVVRYILHANHNSLPADSGRTALHHAALKGHSAVVRELFDAGATLSSSTDDDGQMDLHQAASAGHTEIVRLFLKNGADVNSLNSSRESALHLAASKDIVEMVQLLLDSGAMPDARSLTRMTALHYAVAYPKVVELLLDRKASVDPLDYKDNSPLHMAVRGGYYDSVKHLINRGADVDCTNEDGLSPFHSAIESNLMPMVEMIWNMKRPNLSNACYERNPPAVFAAKKNNVDALQFLCDIDPQLADRPDEYGQTPLYVASQHEHLDIVKKLVLNKEVDVNRPSAYEGGFSPLHRAVEYGLEDVVKILIDGKADVNVRDDLQQTPLHIAAFQGHVGIAQMLLQAGADIRSSREDKKTPLHRGADSKDMVKLLLESGADIEARDNRGWTPLMQVVYWEDKHALNCLLSYKPILDVQAENDWTALHVAADENAPEVIRILLKECESRGVDILDKQADDGSTALHLDVGYSGATVLIELGADFMKKDLKGKTPLQIGAESGRYGFTGNLRACVSRVAKNEAEPLQRDELLKAIRLWNGGGSAKNWEQLNNPTTEPDDWTLDDYLSHLPELRPQEEPDGFTRSVQRKWTLESLVIPDNFWDQGVACTSSITISEDGITVTYKYSGNRDSILSSRADHPFPPRGLNARDYYFEVTVLNFEDGEAAESDANCGPLPTVAVGLCGEFTNLTEAYIGWKDHSVAYHGDDGVIFDSGSSTQAKGPTFAEGATVGCGIDWDKAMLYFTLNGKIVVTYDSDVINRKMYPTVSFGEKSFRARVNFGQEAFTFDPESLKET